MTLSDCTKEECGGTIRYQRIVTVEYTTEPVKSPKPILAHWIKDIGNAE